MDYNQFKHCGLNVALGILSGKWKAIILYHLFYQKEMRFTELWRVIPKVTKKVLLEHLKQMEAQGLITRRELHTFPPEVYYKLSAKGKALAPALSALELWANEYAQEEVSLLRSK
ncbi:helix-turn-helix transcriptional regulator [Pedobacter sp. PAMC26386]|nr:helix-turn-helix transcriptional regulator [Pedobacter sp. PAMC26386]